MNARHVTFDLANPPTRSASPASPSAPTAEMAHTYLLAMRNAGKRINENGINAPAGRDPLEADQKSAISALMGAPVVGPLGSAIDAANRAAQRALRAPMPKAEALATEPYRHGATACPSLAGYVAGMPRPAELTRRSLEAQERLAVEELASATDGAAAEVATAKLRKIQETMDSLP